MQHFVNLDKCTCGSYKYVALREHQKGYEVYLIEHRHIRDVKDTRKYKQLATFRKAQLRPCLIEQDDAKKEIFQVINVKTGRPARGVKVSYLGLESVTDEKGFTGIRKEIPLIAQKESASEEDIGAREISPIEIME
jgi:hypothetical protein